VFVFATTEPQKIAQTAAPVLSRLQRFDFRRIGTAAIRDRLRAVLDAEQIEADDDALTLIARQADGGMRDALSVLDQCLSFGEGRVTAERVREILGLVADQIYAELLEVLATRHPAGVFTLLDRLEDAGADLVEFVGSTGEALRALLMLQVGAKPEGITEALLTTLVGFQAQLSAGDLLRMLKLLGESEAMIRRSANPRLAVETLLLRWTLMDRTVDLESVLAGGPVFDRQSGPVPARVSAPAPVPKPDAPSGVTAAYPARRVPEAPVPEASAGVASRQPVKAEFTLEGLLRAWPDLVVAAREESRFLGEALAAAQPTVVDPPNLTLVVADGNPMHLESLGRQREAAERVLARALGGPVSLTVAEPKGVGGAPPARARRLSEAESRAERLRVLKSRDPALEAAAETLDLEVLE
jgi:DNA polymerase-3 subunit gamma/tau